MRTRTFELGHDKQLLGCIVMPFFYCILSA
nr:MAG TPA: hypothetical protein [Caudoviricetes sp.]